MEEKRTVKLGRGHAEGFGPGEGGTRLGFGGPALGFWAGHGKDEVRFFRGSCPGLGPRP